MSDFDKQQWQAEQAARDAALDKQRESERKARERSARNAKRKLERLHKKLTETGELTEWEGEFAQSVTERLDEYGSAFNDREKGRPGDALSFAQKRVVASLNKKVKDARKDKIRAAQDRDAENGNSEDLDKKPAFKNRSSFKSKGPKFTPRVRNIEDDMACDSPAAKPQPFIPDYAPDFASDKITNFPVRNNAGWPSQRTPSDHAPKRSTQRPQNGHSGGHTDGHSDGHSGGYRSDHSGLHQSGPSDREPDREPDRPMVAKPFLRIVKND